MNKFLSILVSSLLLTGCGGAGSSVKELIDNAKDYVTDHNSPCDFGYCSTDKTSSSGSNDGNCTVDNNAPSIALLNVINDKFDVTLNGSSTLNIASIDYENHSFNVATSLSATDIVKVVKKTNDPKNLIFELTGLKVGNTTMTIIATDSCAKQSIKEINVTVKSSSSTSSGSTVDNSTNHAPSINLLNIKDQKLTLTSGNLFQLKVSSIDIDSDTVITQISVDNPNILSFIKVKEENSISDFNITALNKGLAELSVIATDSKGKQSIVDVNITVVDKDSGSSANTYNTKINAGTESKGIALAGTDSTLSIEFDEIENYTGLGHVMYVQIGENIVAGITFAGSYSNKPVRINYQGKSYNTTFGETTVTFN
ncbi:MAG: hypothetical protein HXX81_05695 [Campylobacterales bacterium]|nr:hypothetical protein [Campylobacterales bacterium]